LWFKSTNKIWQNKHPKVSVIRLVIEFRTMLLKNAC
jgi:hypothetical protein